MKNNRFLTTVTLAVLSAISVSCDQDDVIYITPQPEKTCGYNYVMVDEQSATIISKYNEYWDIVIRFSKVLKNELYSIEKVYLAANSNEELSTEINNRQYLLCQQTTSDMIGPIMVKRPKSGDSWVGGNHLYLNQQTGVKSATTESYSIYADGTPIEQGSSYANVVTIKVENTIFDPDVAPSGDERILSEPLITESVSYNISEGEILVGVEHRYLKDVRVGVYYGMQSMFLPKKDATGNTVNVQFITAEGGDSNWRLQPTGNEKVYIKKADAPNLNRFSQKHEYGHYQNTVLLPHGLGTHNYVNDNIFVYSGNKAYHVLIQNKNIAKDAILSWKGVYNWNRPILDNDDYYIYQFGNGKRKESSITKKRTAP